MDLWPAKNLRITFNTTLNYPQFLGCLGRVGCLSCTLNNTQILFLTAFMSLVLLLIALLTNPSNRYVFVVVFLFAVLLQSPTKWYMKLVPVSQLMSATLFHLRIHSDCLFTLLPLCHDCHHFITCVFQPVTSLLHKHCFSAPVLCPCDLLKSKNMHVIISH